MLSFNLPYPPTINHYYVRTKKGLSINAKGKAYRELICYTLMQCITSYENVPCRPLRGDLRVDIIIYPPDKRKRDMDNIKKALFDALQYAGLFDDDYQICEDYTVRRHPVKNGLIELKIKCLGRE